MKYRQTKVVLLPLPMFGLSAAIHFGEALPAGPALVIGIGPGF